MEAVQAGSVTPCWAYTSKAVTSLASKYDSIYGASETVTPLSREVIYLIHY